MRAKTAVNHCAGPAALQCTLEQKVKTINLLQLGSACLGKINWFNNMVAQTLLHFTRAPSYGPSTTKCNERVCANSELTTVCMFSPDTCSHANSMVARLQNPAKTRKRTSHYLVATSPKVNLMLCGIAGAMTEQTLTHRLFIAGTLKNREATNTYSLLGLFAV